jgi:SAM-dependent methyltransferase/uncharacterized protein YbaR (Trm112 family)
VSAHGLGPRVDGSLLEVLRCPACRAAFGADAVAGGPLYEGLLRCTGCGAAAPVRQGVVRLTELEGGEGQPPDRRSRTSFSLEWSLYRPSAGTWGMTLAERTEWYFLHGIGLTAQEVAGLRVLDAGCGNGSSTLGIARLGADCVGIDQSHGVDHAHEHFTATDTPLHLGYVQGNLLDAPFAAQAFDVVFSAGVLHHTKDTRQAFLALAPLVKPGGRYYVWLYRREPRVTAAVNTIRSLTTRLPPRVFFAVAVTGAPLFQGFAWLANRTGLRSYRPLSWRAAALALIDIFGAPYAHAHTPDEVAGWFAEAGFDPQGPPREERRGFGMCGLRRPRP